MHKPSPVLRKLERGTSNTIENEDLERQDRLSKVLMLHSRGYSQSEIARKLNVNQYTVSRDIAELRKKARGSLDLYVKEEIPKNFSSISLD
jgi:DNA-binding transcriptional regulator LsrR (DeoR family)